MGGGGGIVPTNSFKEITHAQHIDDARRSVEQVDNLECAQLSLNTKATLVRIHVR